MRRVYVILAVLLVTGAAVIALQDGGFVKYRLRGGAVAASPSLLMDVQQLLGLRDFHSQLGQDKWILGEVHLSWPSSQVQLSFPQLDRSFSQRFRVFAGRIGQSVKRRENLIGEYRSGHHCRGFGSDWDSRFGIDPPRGPGREKLEIALLRRDRGPYAALRVGEQHERGKELYFMPKRDVGGFYHEGMRENIFAVVRDGPL